MTNKCNLKQASILAVIAARIFVVVNALSISSVALTNRTEIPVSSTKLGLINIPQVPEFPKFNARPVLPSLPTQQQDHHEPEPEHLVDDESAELSSEEEESHHEEENYSHEVEVDIPQQETPAVEIEAANLSPVATFSTKNETSKHAELAGSEKIQETNEFKIPLHVMTILNALAGGGGSIAQASKPEKDGVGQGYTTANAVGYASGDDASVTASVSNKMELNAHTVILTESASASASSASNGTAFSQATLASNGYTSQHGWGGWKGINKNLPEQLNNSPSS